MITPDRQKQIDEATPENPVDLTPEEETELRTRNRTRFQYDVGAGRFRVKAKPDSPADKVLILKDQGLSNSAIAKELDLNETNVRQILSRVYS